MNGRSVKYSDFGIKEPTFVPVFIFFFLGLSYSTVLSPSSLGDDSGTGRHWSYSNDRSFYPFSSH